VALQSALGGSSIKPSPGPFFGSITLQILLYEVASGSG